MPATAEAARPHPAATVATTAARARDHPALFTRTMVTSASLPRR
jgi:hypothetical protein